MTTLISDPIFYLVAVPAILLSGVSKGGFGSAVGGFGVPLMALAISPPQAAAILLPVLCLMDLVGFRLYYQKWDLPNLKIIVPGALVGIIIGTLTFGLLNEGSIRILIGVIAVLFTLNNWFGFAKRQEPTGRAAIKGTIWSSVSGFTSFVAHAGGPPLMIYLLPQRLDKITFVATANLFFLIINFVKLLPYAWLGQLSSDNLLTSLMLSPLAPAGVWVGLWLQQRINHEWFYRIAQGCLFLTGLQLIYQGSRGLH